MPAYRFGPFELDTSAYRLSRAGKPVAIAPKSLDLLQLFVEQPGALLTKEAILDALWTEPVTDNALTQVVSELREALGDSATSPQFVKTVPTRGYRFVASVTSDAPAAPVDPPKAPRGPRTLVVQPFVNLTGDPADEWLTAGIAETVTNELNRLKGLTVIDPGIARTSKIADRRDAPPADFVVTGSVQRVADSLRVTSRVVDGETGEVVINARADGAVASVFAVQDDIVRQLLAGLELRAVAPPGRSRARETSDFEAYRALTEARLVLETLDLERISEAEAGFRRALSIDPGYALAEVGLGHAEFWRFQASRGSNRVDVAALAAAVGHARQALALDAELAEAHAALALFLASAGAHGEAVEAGRRAVSLEPGNWRHQFRLGMAAWGSERLLHLGAVTSVFPELAYAHFGIAMVLAARGDFEHVEERLTAAIALSAPDGRPLDRFPASGLHWLVGMAELERGDLERAAESFDAEVARASGRLLSDEYSRDANDGLGFVHLARQDTAGASSAFERALDRYPGHVRSLLGLAETCRRAGALDRATRLTQQASAAAHDLASAGRLHDAKLAEAMILVASERPSAALDVLSAVLAATAGTSTGWLIGLEPLFRPLRTQPAFHALRQRLSDNAR